MNIFIESFGCEYEINNLHDRISKVNDLENIYFVSGDGIGDLKRRCRDSDVTHKTYFSVDIDYKENLGRDVSEKELEQLASDIVEKMKDDVIFKDWSWIVMSGNGLHIHFIGKKIAIEPKVYARAVRHYFRVWNERYEKCDVKCNNASRLMRLPGTVNQKNGRRVRILYSQRANCGLISMIPEIGEKVIREERKEAIRQNKEQEKNIKKNFGEYGRLAIMDINRLPIYVFVNKVIPEARYDGRKNFRKPNGRGNKFFGFYIYNNLLINGGSDHFSNRDCYSTFSFVRDELLGLNDTREGNTETFLFFKNYLGTQEI